MIFDRNDNKQVVALLGAGSMGTAIVRRIGAGKKILLGDISEKALQRVGDDFRRCGYDVDTHVVNALQRESVEAFARKAAELGPVMCIAARERGGICTQSRRAGAGDVLH